MNPMVSCSHIETLPEDCVCMILLHLSPSEACIFSLVSSTLRSAADSAMIWKSFLPSDYEDIVSRVVDPLPLKFSSFKQLFCSLCSPLLLDGGDKSFTLDKYLGKKSYILSARELSIAWSNEPMYWSWRKTPESRFPTVAELRTTNWLQIECRIRTGMLTPNTLYGAYLIMNVSHRGYGLDYAPAEVSVSVGNRVKRGKAYLWQKDEKKRMIETLLHGNRREMLRKALIQQGQEDELGIRVPSKREDGWMEIELGEFFIGDEDDEVNLSLMEVGYQLKGGLILEGIELRPLQA